MKPREEQSKKPETLMNTDKIFRFSNDGDRLDLPAETPKLISKPIEIMS